MVKQGKPNKFSKQKKDEKSKDPTYKPYKDRRLKQMSGLGKKKVNKHFWSDQQNNRYVQFLQKHRDSFETLERRFLKMSRHVHTRYESQCRSHHQKMIKTYENIDSIIQYLGKSSIKLSQEQQLHSQQPGDQMFVSSTNQYMEEQEKASNQQNQKIEVKSPPVVLHFEDPQNIFDVIDSNSWSDQP